MKNTEIRELSDKELLVRTKEEKGGYAKTMLSHSISPVDNPNKMKESKKLIARLLTEKRRRELTKAQ